MTPAVRTMYDSVSPRLIPATAQMVAGYVTGRWAWHAADWARFPRAAHVRIDVNGTAPFGSDVIDVERGDADPLTARTWVRQRMSRGWWSAAYVDKSGLPALRDALAGLDVEYWVADWTGVPHVVDGTRICAVQYASTSSYDLSVVPNPAWFPEPMEAAA